MKALDAMNSRFVFGCSAARRVLEKKGEGGEQLAAMALVVLALP
jgi:hypothetical protein